MDPVDRYREVIKAIVNKYAQLRPSHGNIRFDAVTDGIHDRYGLFQAGWNRGDRVDGCLLYVTLDGGKVHIEYDGINYGIYDELIQAGIPAEDIVLEYLHEQSVKATA